VDLPKFLPLSTPARPAPLRFITTLRARSTLRGRTGSNATGLEMPALVVTLLLRRRGAKGQTGAVTKRTFVPRASKLRLASWSLPTHILDCDVELQLALELVPRRYSGVEQVVRPGHVASLSRTPPGRRERDPFVLASPYLSSARTAIYLPLLRSRPCLRLSSPYPIETPARILTATSAPTRCRVFRRSFAYLYLHHEFHARMRAHNSTIH
jgi:hypothetical protein